MKKAIILLSGGLDSTTCLALAHSKGYACYSLSFDYGQKHDAELQAAARVAKHYQVAKHQVVNLQALGQLGGSALTDDEISVDDFKGDGEIPATYVPARNTVFLSVALGYAEIIGANTIYVGVSAIDYSGYPDCRPQYIDAFQAMANLATKTGVEGHIIRIKTPLIYLSKAETIQLGNKLGVDYSITTSCYRANAQGHACGTCDSCVLRQQGFVDAGIVDPTCYVA